MYQFKELLLLLLFVKHVSSQGDCNDPASASCLSEAQYLIQNCGIPSASSVPDIDVWATCACPNIYPLVTDCIKPDLCADAALLLEYKPRIESICQRVFNTVHTTSHSATVITITSTASTTSTSSSMPSASEKSDQARAESFYAIFAVAIITLIM